MNVKRKEFDKLMDKTDKCLRKSVLQIKEFQDVSELDGLKLENVKEAHKIFKDALYAIDTLYRDKE